MGRSCFLASGCWRKAELPTGAPFMSNIAQESDRSTVRSQPTEDKNDTRGILESSGNFVNVVNMLPGLRLSCGLDHL